LLAGCRGRGRCTGNSSALVERACRRIALTELREALGGSARCADQAKKTYSFPCVPQGKTHSFFTFGPRSELLNIFSPRQSHYPGTIPRTPMADEPVGVITQRAYARIGLLGNPSDGYFGKTLSISIQNFFAEVHLTPNQQPLSSVGQGLACLSFFPPVPSPPSSSQRHQPVLRFISRPLRSSRHPPLRCVRVLHIHTFRGGVGRQHEPRGEITTT